MCLLSEFAIVIVNDIRNLAFGPAKASVYGFGRSWMQKFVDISLSILAEASGSVWSRRLPWWRIGGSRRYSGRYEKL